MSMANADAALQVPFEGRRRMIALAGAPASGKSTMAQNLAERDGTVVVPMDGFHLDNAVLEHRGLLARKGAPDTFDVVGFTRLLERMKAEEEVIFPQFDRALDKSIAGCGIVGPDTHTVIVEGNYLLLDHPDWVPLQRIWDATVRLVVPEDVLRQRLIDRWLGYGYSQADALAKVDGNDLMNVELVQSHSIAADFEITDV